MAVEITLLSSMFLFVAVQCSAEIIDRTGKIVTSPKGSAPNYELPKYRFELRERSANSSEYEIIDRESGHIIALPRGVVPVKDQMRTMYPLNEDGLFRVDVKDLLVADSKPVPGLFSAKLQRVLKLPHGYEDASGCQEERISFAVMRSSKRLWGFLDTDGKVAVPPIYDEAGWFTEGLCPVQLGPKWSYIDKNGKTAIALPDTCHRADYFFEGLASVVIGSDPIEPSGWPGKNNKLGFIDKQGNIVIKPQFYAKWRNPGFSHGLAAVMADDPRLLSGYIDTKGNWVIPPQFTRAEQFQADGTVCVERGVAKFNKEEWTKWTDPNSRRYPLFQAFLVDPGINGMSREALHKYLGAPDEVKGENETYILAAGHGGVNYACFHFENDKITKFSRNPEDNASWHDTKLPFRGDE